MVVLHDLLHHRFAARRPFRHPVHKLRSPPAWSPDHPRHGTVGLVATYYRQEGMDLKQATHHRFLFSRLTQTVLVTWMMDDPISSSLC